MVCYNRWSRNEVGFVLHLRFFFEIEEFTLLGVKSVAGSDAHLLRLFHCHIPVSQSSNSIIELCGVSYFFILECLVIFNQFVCIIHILLCLIIQNIDNGVKLILRFSQLLISLWIIILFVIVNIVTPSFGYGRRSLNML